MNTIITKNEERRVHEIEAFVESETTTGAYWRVNFTLEVGWTCTCPQNAMRHKECKHIESVREELG